LQLLREFLREDGSIWVTIDDNEGHYLKVMMDEVFGRGNFVANVVWQKKYTVANDAKWLADNHDHVHVYARMKEGWRPHRLPRTEAMDKRYRNPDSHRDGPWKATPLYAKRTPSEKEQGFTYAFKNGVIWTLPAGTSPRFPPEELARMDANDEIWFGADGAAVPTRKTFLGKLTIEAGNNHEAREESKFVNGVEVFGTPKPERLLQRILALATRPNDLVLDSFLGSGTTAAVAHKMGRRWIGIEMGEHAVTHCLPRMQKVLAGEQGGISQTVNWQGGGGFQLLQLGAPLFDAQGDIHPDVRFADLARFIWLRETGTAMAMVAAGTPLLGVFEGTGHYLLFNGVLGDRRPASGNVLTTPVLQALQQTCWHSGPKEGITFKQLPHAVPR
jgi:adenine-specific DNA-methyltransferase